MYGELKKNRLESINKKVLLIYTGGTIGMIKDYDSGALKAFNFKDLLSHIPELKLLDCAVDTYSFENPIDSSNMNPTYWIRIATVIENAYALYDGFVVLHGTDTMSYTASALSFLLENLSKPVIFTGSQLPIGDLRTDAKENLITSIHIASLKEAGKAVIQEVGLYFEYTLYRGNRTTKINTEHFNAFASLNYPALLESGVHLNVFKEHLWKNKEGETFFAHKKMDSNVALLKIFPGLTQKLLHSILQTPGLRALILETYGSGNAFTAPWFLNELKKAKKNNILLINVTQCSGGSVVLGKYETSKAMLDLQVISGKDITTEAAVTKLMFLLGVGFPIGSVKTIFETSLRGEMYKK